MILHILGSHYTYSEVPLGYFLQDLFGASRNMYDRLVHFSFGLLLGYPLREVFVRITKAKGFWGYWFPFEITLAFSCIYELIEWWAAISVDPSAGLAFVGSQGDIWDAQKDMLMAGIGAIIIMLITASINMFIQKDFKREFIDSLKPSKRDAPLGEKRLEKLLYKK